MSLPAAFIIVPGGNLATPRLRHKGRQEAGQCIGDANSRAISLIAQGIAQGRRSIDAIFAMKTKFPAAESE
ncbi:MAG: hypothetical protein WAK66_11355 [Methylocystis sp.]